VPSSSATVLAEELAAFAQSVISPIVPVNHPGFLGNPELILANTPKLFLTAVEFQTTNIGVLNFLDNSTYQNLGFLATVVVTHTDFADEIPSEDFVPYAIMYETNSAHTVTSYVAAQEFEKPL
jgi:hypothetical protein